MENSGNTILEKMARAICAELASDCNEVVKQDMTIQQVVDQQWMGFLPTARLVACSMLLPTDEMIEAGALSISDGMFDGSVRAKKCYQAMLKSLVGVDQ